MSQIPRRTSEFQVASTDKRARSRGATSFGTSLNRIVTATPMKTPMRTPIRSTGFKERMTMVQMTAEKEKAPLEDREFLNSRLHLVLDELSKQEKFNELVQKGLKTMTLKNFISILEYLLEPILGAPPKDFSTNYVEHLHNLLIQLEYPYNINKSSLKTPNAPHCFNNIVILLAWLADFSKVDEESIQYRPTEELSNLESMKTFMDQTSEAYKLFNDEKDYAHVEQKIRETYYEKRSANPDIEAEIHRIKFEIGQFNKEIKPSIMLQKLNEKKAEANEYDSQIESRNKKIGEMNRKITNLKATLGYKQQAFESAQKDLKSLDSQLKQQKMTVEARQKILIEITHLKSALMSKRNAVMEIAEASSENEIALSNLISRKFQLTDCLNNLLYKISSVLDVFDENFNPELYEIKSSSDSRMDEMIENMHKILIGLKNKYFKMLLQLKEATVMNDSELHKQNMHKGNVESKFLELQKTLKKIEEEESIAEQELSTLVTNMRCNYNERKQKIKENEKIIAERTKEIAKMEVELKEQTEKRENFGKKAVDECEKLFLERKQEVETRRAHLRETIEIIEKFQMKRQTKPLSKKLQALANELLEENKMNNRAE